MKHYTKILASIDGSNVKLLIDNNGERVESFYSFIYSLTTRNYAHLTVNRYADVVANFLDYLTEAGVFGTPATLREINDAVERYIPIRLRAAELRNMGRANATTEFEKWAVPIVESLEIRPLARSSLDNTLAAINAFLELSTASHRLQLEEAKYNGVELDEGPPQSIFEALSGEIVMPEFQKRSMMQYSMLASVVRLNPDGIKRPKRLSAKATKRSRNVRKEFPFEFLQAVFDTATSWRDRCLWLLIAAAGLRPSEAAQIRWPDIFIKKRRVYIEDPKGLRFSAQLSKKERLRFKGREVSETYLTPPLKEMFFEALAMYTRFEYTPSVEHDFVFQDIRKGHNGRPYYETSDEARGAAFRRACEKAGVPLRSDGKRYTIRSLRHFYGVFMLNYLPVPGGYGLKLSEVQKLLGHADINATALYAREDTLILESKLLFADEALFLDGPNLATLPKLIAARLESEAKKIRDKQT